MPSLPRIRQTKRRTTTPPNTNDQADAKTPPAASSLTGGVFVLRDVLFVYERQNRRRIFCVDFKHPTGSVDTLVAGPMHASFRNTAERIRNLSYDFPSPEIGLFLVLWSKCSRVLLRFTTHCNNLFVCKHVPASLIC